MRVWFFGTAPFAPLYIARAFLYYHHSLWRMHICSTLVHFFFFSYFHFVFFAFHWNEIGHIIAFTQINMAFILHLYPVAVANITIQYSTTTSNYTFFVEQLNYFSFCCCGCFGCNFSVVPVSTDAIYVCTKASVSLWMSTDRAWTIPFVVWCVKWFDIHSLDGQ